MAEWAGAAAILALIAKGASKGDIQTPDEKEKAIKDLTEAKATLEEKLRELELEAKSSTLAAKKDFLFEQKQKADNEKRAIAEAEAVWARATPEVLLKFAQKRLEEPAPAAAEPAVDKPAGTAAEPVVNKPPGTAATNLPGDTSTLPRTKEKMEGGAVAPVSKVYQDLADSSMARAYVVRGSLVGLYEKVKKAMEANKQPPPEKIPFLEAAKNDLIAAAETLAGVKETDRAKVRAESDAMKAMKAKADAAVSSAKGALSKAQKYSSSSRRHSRSWISVSCLLSTDGRALGMPSAQRRPPTHPDLRQRLATS